VAADILSARDGGILTVTLFNPDKFNALDAAMWQRLAEVFAAADGDDTLRCVIVRGAGAAFAAGGDLAEGTDFARSARQQILIKAIVSKMTQISEWPHLWSAMGALQKSIYTNLSAYDLFSFVRKMDLNNAKRIGLTNQNVLVDGTSSDGQYILQPRDGNWSLIPQYIQQQLGS